MDQSLHKRAKDKQRLLKVTDISNIGYLIKLTQSLTLEIIPFKKRFSI